MYKSFPIGLLSLSVLLSGSCTQQTEQQKPNVVFLLADDLGYNDVSCYRDAHSRHSDKPPTSQTPAIDELVVRSLIKLTFTLFLVSHLPSCTSI